MNPIHTFALSLPLPVFIIDQSGHVLAQNEKFAQRFRSSTGNGAPFTSESIAALLQSGTTSPSFRSQLATPFGIHVEGSAIVTPEGILCALVNVPEEETLFRLFRFLSPVIGQAGISYLITNESGDVVYVNGAFAELTGYPVEECIGRQVDFLRSRRHGDDFYDDLWGTIRSGKVYRGVVFNQHRDGHLLICDEVVSPVRNERGDIDWFIFTDRDLNEQFRLETQLRQSQDHLRRVIEWAPLGISVIDSGGMMLETNAAMAAMLGYSREELCAKNVSEILHSDEGNAMDRMATLHQDGMQSYSVVHRYLKRDGQALWARVHVALLPGTPEVGEPYFITMVEDITDRRLADAKLESTLSELQDLQDSIDTIAMRLQTDGAGIVQSANDNFLNLIGTKLSAIVGRPLNRDWLHVSESDYTDIVHAVTGGRLWKGELEILSERGAKHWLDAMIIPRTDEIGNVRSVRIILFDVTLRKRAEEAIVYQAFHDSLTGLPNRSLLLDRLFTAISRARRTGEHLAILFLDLDRFKSINDTLGHTIGDRLLKRASDRLQSVLRDYDTVARTGGDEFVLLLPGLEEAAQVVAVVERIQELMAEPFEIEGHELHVPTSVGISVYPDDGLDPDTLIKNADVALYRAKELGRNCFVFYNPEQNVYSHDRLALENEMRRALRDRQFCLFFQPQVDLATKRLAGFETLARWNHPARGLISPGLFIPIAEETGMILQLGDQVLRDSFRTAAEWYASRSEQFHLSVNISGRQFYQKRFLADLLGMRDMYRLPAGFLELEITETIAMQMTPSTLDILLRLREEGFTIALDDFGTGYSSLKYLREFPLDVLKIDRSFIMGLEEDIKKQNILRSILDLARSLDLKIVAEGVELESQLNLLQEMGCQMVQGFYYSPPVPEEHALQFFSRTF